MLDAVKSRIAAEAKGFAGSGRAGHEAVGERVGGKNVQFAPWLDHESSTVLTGKINPPIPINWRGNKFAAHSFGPDRVARGSIQARDETFVGGRVDEAIHQNRRGVLPDARFDLPHDMSVSHVAFAIGFNGPKLLPGKARDDVSQATVVKGPGSNRVIGILDLPQFPPRSRIVSIRSLGASAEHEGLALRRDNQRRAERFAQITIARHLAGDILVVP